MTKYINYIVLFSFLLVSGCTTFEEARKQLEKSLPDNEKAYLVGKYSVQCEPNSKNTSCEQGFNSISLYYRNLGNQKQIDRLDSTNGSMFGGDTVYDQINYENKEKSFYFCRILPAGNYSIYSISYWNFAGGGSGYNLSESDQFKIPFKLEAGKISSIDHLKLTTDKGKSLFGISFNAPGYLQISSLSEEELSIALKKCAESAKGKEVINQNLFRQKYNSPFIKVNN